MDGLELEGRYRFGSGFEVIGNVSNQSNENDDNSQDVTYSPDLMVKTGVTYHSASGYRLSIFNSYFSASTLQNRENNPVLFTNSNADAYHLLTVNLQIDLANFTKSLSLTDTTISFYVDNLLNEDIYFPSINRRSVNSIPHHHGRGIYGTVTHSL